MPNSKSFPHRIIGIDYGLKRIGLALSDERKILATPLKTIIAGKTVEQTVKILLKEIADIQAFYNCVISAVVIGLPLFMNGTVSPLAQEVMNFTEIVKQMSSLPIYTWDERLTTMQAERALKESSMNRKHRTKVVDTVSATIILQNYLDFQSNNPKN